MPTLTQYGEALVKAIAAGESLADSFSSVTRRFSIGREYSVPPHHHLSKETDDSFAWLDRRIQKWTNAFETEFLQLVPPDTRLNRLHDAFAQFLTTRRNHYYYHFAYVMYFLRDNKTTAFQFEEAALTSQRLARTMSIEITELFDEMQTEFPHILEYLGMPDWFVPSLVRERTRLEKAGFIPLERSTDQPDAG